MISKELRGRGAAYGSRWNRPFAPRIATLIALAVSAGVGISVLPAAASPTGSSAKKCKHAKKHKGCRNPKATKPAKGRISLTNCPTADLAPNAPYTFTGRVTPARARVSIVIQYFDQGSTPLAVHTVATAPDGSFSDTYAYPATGIRRGGTVRASSTTAIDPVCQVTVGEM